MDKYTHIYGLKEKDGIIRYVGKSDNIEKRLKNHIREAKKNNKTWKQRWINKVLKNNGILEVICLETVLYENWSEREIYWIDELKNNRLTNHAKGGTGGATKKYKITYIDFKFWVKTNLPNIKSQTQWNKNKINLPDFIPNKPDLVFKDNGWISWGDFLDTNSISNRRKNFITIQETKEWLKNNNVVFNKQSDWNEWVKNEKVPNFIPKAPEHAYKNKGWISWGDFFGTNSLGSIVKHNNYINLFESKKIAKINNIKSQEQWINYVKNCKDCINTPLNPDKTYINNGWISWYDFLDKKENNFIDINNAISTLKEYKIKNTTYWREFIKNDKFTDLNIPRNPDYYYKDKGWEDWGGFLSNNNLRNRTFLSFTEAKKITQKNDINTHKKWRKFIKENGNELKIPSSPDKTYKNEWIDWVDWFGIIGYLSFNEARNISRKYKLKTKREWKKFIRLNNKKLNIPINPNFVYKNEWVDWYDWLGKEK